MLYIALPEYTGIELHDYIPGLLRAYVEETGRLSFNNNPGYPGNFGRKGKIEKGIFG